jgi:hypothetical protein
VFIRLFALLWIILCSVAANATDAQPRQPRDAGCEPVRQRRAAGLMPGIPGLHRN